MRTDVEEFYVACMITKLMGRHFGVVNLGEDAEQKCFDLAISMRFNEIPVATDCPSDMSLKGQLRLINRLGYPYCIIIGDDEIKKGIFILKDMVEHTQKELNYDKIMRYLRNEIEKETAKT